MNTAALRNIVLAGVVTVGVGLTPACGGQHDAPTFTDTSDASVTTSPTPPSGNP